MSRGGNINRPFYFAPRREYRLRGFYFGRNQKAVLMGVQRQKRFSGISIPPITETRAHAPKNARKIDFRPAPKITTPTRPQSTRIKSIPPPTTKTISPSSLPFLSPLPFHTTHHPPSTLNTSLPLSPSSLPSIKRGLTGRKWGTKPYKTPQNRRIRKLSKTIQNSPKPPKISSSPVFI